MSLKPTSIESAAQDVLERREMPFHSATIMSGNIFKAIERLIRQTLLVKKDIALPRRAPVGIVTFDSAKTWS